MKFQHMPVVEAVQFTGDNWDEIRAFAGASRYVNLVFPTDLKPEYFRHLQLGDWLVKNSMGNLCISRTEVFAKDYIPITEADL